MQTIFLIFSFLLPTITFACGLGSVGDVDATSSLMLEIAVNAILVLTIPTVIFYIVLRMIPRFSTQSILWAVKKTGIFFVIILVCYGWFLFQASTNSFCLTENIENVLIPLPQTNN